MNSVLCSEHAVEPQVVLARLLIWAATFRTLSVLIATCLLEFSLRSNQTLSHLTAGSIAWGVMGLMVREFSTTHTGKYLSCQVRWIISIYSGAKAILLSQLQLLIRRMSLAINSLQLSNIDAVLYRHILSAYPNQWVACCYISSARLRREELQVEMFTMILPNGCRNSSRFNFSTLQNSSIL